MDAELAEVMLACPEGWLDAVTISAYPKCAAAVVTAAGGYPGPRVRGDTITLRDPPDDNILFHAGTKGPTATKRHDDKQHALQPLSTHGAHSLTPLATHPSESLTTSGGRVITATSKADTLEAAVSQAYKGMSTMHLDNIYFRKDIGKRGLRDQLASEMLANSGGLTYASAGRGRAPQLEIGAFGGAFVPVEAGYTSPPTLIEGTDGVGTKLEIAHAIGKHDTI
ncbi:MAG: hypothetical protein Q9161_001828 [Pseudevernia consocians]